MQVDQNGRSMIEMLGVLAIIGVLSVGGIAGYSKAMNQYRVNKTVDQVSQLAQNIRTLYSSQKNYNNLNYDVIKKAHLAPDDMYEGSGTELTNPFGGRVHLSLSHKSAGEVGYKAFYITVGGLPQEACMQIATYDWGSGTSSGLIVVSAGENLRNVVNYVYQGCPGYPALPDPPHYVFACPNGTRVPVPMPVSVAAQACQAGTKNDVELKFY